MRPLSPEDAEYVRLVVEERTCADYAADFEEILLDGSVEKSILADHSPKGPGPEPPETLVADAYDVLSGLYGDEHAESVLEDAARWVDDPEHRLDECFLCIVPLASINGSVFRAPSGRPIVLIDHGLGGFVSVALQLLQSSLDSPWFSTPLSETSAADCWSALAEWCRSVARNDLEDLSAVDTILEAEVSTGCAGYIQEVDRFVVLHELAHILNGDVAGDGAEEVIRSPERELRADRVALNAIAGRDRDEPGRTRASRAVGAFMLVLSIVESLASGDASSSSSHPGSEERWRLAQDEFASDVLVELSEAWKNLTDVDVPPARSEGD